MGRATSPAANRTYGIQRVCLAWRISRATVPRFKAAIGNGPATHAKRGPKGFLDDGELLVEIRAELASTLFGGPHVSVVHRKVLARLRHERGIRTSMRRVLRIMREHPSVSMMMRRSPSLQTIRATTSVHHAGKPCRHA